MNFIPHSILKFNFFHQIDSAISNQLDLKQAAVAILVTEPEATAQSGLIPDLPRTGLVEHKVHVWADFRLDAERVRFIVNKAEEAVGVLIIP